MCRCVNKHTLERKAVKIIMKEDMQADEKDLLRAEIAIMKLVNHPNIVRMEAVYESKKVITFVFCKQEDPTLLFFTQDCHVVGLPSPNCIRRLLGSKQYL